VGTDAKISLDGKDAKLGDLKAGHYARVTVRRGAGRTGGADKDKGSTDKGTTGKDKAGGDKEKGRGGRGGMLNASRVEAFTKMPAGGKDKGGRGKDTGTSKDK